MIDNKVCSELGYEWTDEAEAIYQKNKAEEANRQDESEPAPEAVTPEKPNLETTVRVAYQTAWYNDGGDSDQETYWGVHYRNSKDINDHTLSAEFPVYMFNNPDNIFDWYSCEPNMGQNSTEMADKIIIVKEDRKGHSLLLWLLFGWILLYTPAIWFTFSSRHRWHL